MDLRVEEPRVDPTPVAAENHGFDIDDEDLKPRPLRLPSRRPVLVALAVVLLVVFLAAVPPLVSMERYRKRITQSISLSLGRPVRIDRVALQVLPAPGFTLSTFVVGEDPAFGLEPVIRANTVTVRLRVSSLWRGRLEFRSISLEDPSVNLVRRADGQWNFESILLQASRMPAAPTAQRRAGPSPRFPYIEASGARVNIKEGLRKLPVALTDSKFALWLPEPQQWHVRLQGHIARTDVAVNDTGVFHLEGTLGRAASLPQVPVDVHAEWTGAPLGGLSLVLLGRDMGMRGTMDLAATLRGTLSNNTIDTRLAVHGLRRADFVPDQMLDLSARCTAQAVGVFASLAAVHCASPGQGASPQLDLTGSLPDLAHPLSAQAQLRIAAVPAAGLLTVLHVVSERVSPSLHASGTLSGELHLGAAELDSETTALAGTEGDAPQGRFAIAGARLDLGDLQPFVAEDNLSAAVDGHTFFVEPFPLELGGPTPATLSITCAGALCGMHLSGSVLRSRLLGLAQALPQFGDGLEAALPPALSPADAATTPPVPEIPIHIDLVSTRELGAGQTWQPAPPAVRPPAPPRRRKR